MRIVENAAALKRAEPIVAAVNTLEPQFTALSDEALRAKTEEFKVGYPDLTVTIRFSHGCSLLLTPDPEAAGKGSDDEPLEDWTLFYPEGMWLGVGPGPVWRSQGAEEPLS